MLPLQHLRDLQAEGGLLSDRHGATYLRPGNLPPPQAVYVVMLGGTRDAPPPQHKSEMTDEPPIKILPFRLAISHDTKTIGNKDRRHRQPHL
jgi:hypothetical protein